MSVVSTTAAATYDSGLRNHQDLWKTAAKYHYAERSVSTGQGDCGHVDVVKEASRVYLTVLPWSASSWDTPSLPYPRFTSWHHSGHLRLIASCEPLASVRLSVTRLTLRVVRWTCGIFCIQVQWWWRWPAYPTSLWHRPWDPRSVSDFVCGSVWGVNIHVTRYYSSCC